MSKESNNDKERQKEHRRKEILSKLAGFCIKRNFKFDVISPKKWITLTFESRNEKQDQGIDIFIDVKTRDDIYFVIPAAYDVLFDEEIPAVLKAVNINNNFVNPARCSYSERSKKVIVDFTYPLIDGDVTLEQFSRVLMFILESAEALRDNITRAQKKIDHFDDDKKKSPLKDDISEKITNTKMYLSKLGAVLGEEIDEAEDNIISGDNRSNVIDSDDDIEDKSEYQENESDEFENSDEFEDTDFDEDDEYMEDFDNEDSEDLNSNDEDDKEGEEIEDDFNDSKRFGHKLVNFFDDVVKNMDGYDKDEEEEDNEDDDDKDSEEEF